MLQSQDNVSTLAAGLTTYYDGLQSGYEFVFSQGKNEDGDENEEELGEEDDIDDDALYDSDIDVAPTGDNASYHERNIVRDLNKYIVDPAEPLSDNEDDSKYFDVHSKIDKDSNLKSTQEVATIRSFEKSVDNLQKFGEFDVTKSFMIIDIFLMTQVNTNPVRVKIRQFHLPYQSTQCYCT